MAANQFRMSYDSMKERAKQYSTEADNLGDIITNLENLNAMLEDEWEGEGFQAYSEKYGEYKGAFEKARELLESVSEALEKSAEAAEAADQGSKAAFN